MVLKIYTHFILYLLDLYSKVEQMYRYPYLAKTQIYWFIDCCWLDLDIAVDQDRGLC